MPAWASVVLLPAANLALALVLSAVVVLLVGEIPQFPLIREAVRAFDIPCLEQAGFEADDLIATYARQACEVGAR